MCREAAVGGFRTLEYPDGDVADSDLIRIGAAGDQTRTFIAGIFGSNVLGGALPVEVDRNGQLGTVLSSRRVKDDIRDMQGASGALRSRARLIDELTGRLSRLEAKGAAAAR